MRYGRVTAIAATVVLAGAVAPAAQAAKVVNGGFERGNLSGWQQNYFPSADVGRWFIYPVTPRARGVFPAPPQGEFGAVTDQGDPSVQILSQVVKLKPDKRHRLSFQLAYDNAAVARRRGSGFITPNSLTLAQPNQQFRMDVMRPGAPIRSTRRKHVLARVYRTEVGDPNSSGYRRVSANLTELAGKEVRLRFAVAVTENPLNAAIDAVKVRTKAP